MNRVQANIRTTDSSWRGASRFYWAWLVFATSVSILGNIAHALLVAPADLRLLAAIASVVPPIFVVGSTHSVALGLTMRRLALAHTVGLVMTIGVAACAFVLSFDALRSLAIMLGWPSAAAWLFPIVIDVSIAQATFGLLSVSSLRQSVAADVSTAHGQAASSPALAIPHECSSRVSTAASVEREEAATGDGSGTWRVTATAKDGASEDVSAGNVSKPGHVDIFADRTPPAPIEASEVLRWEPTARELVRNGMTSKDPGIVAGILAEYAMGIPPTTISRRRKVHHSTVGRIIEGARSLAG